MSKITYTNIVKFPWTQRLWEGSDGEFYLADESADEDAHDGIGPHRANPGHLGRPDETCDGPLQIVCSEPINAEYGEDGLKPTGFKVAVLIVNPTERHNRTHCKVSVCFEGAFYLAELLGMTVITNHGSYTVANAKGDIDV